LDDPASQPQVQPIARTAFPGALPPPFAGCASWGKFRGQTNEECSCGKGVCAVPIRLLSVWKAASPFARVADAHGPQSSPSADPQTVQGSRSMTVLRFEERSSSQRQNAVTACRDRKRSVKGGNGINSEGFDERLYAGSRPCASEGRGYPLAGTDLTVLCVVRTGACWGGWLRFGLMPSRSERPTPHFVGPLIPFPQLCASADRRLRPSRPPQRRLRITWPRANAGL
jgi:hypothetical protein